MRVALQSFGTGFSIVSTARHGTTTAMAGPAARKGTRGMIRWLMLACGAAMLGGCVSPSYPAYPTPIYLPPPYVIQPPYAAQPPGPVPLYPVPEPRPQPAPPPEDVEAPVGVPEPLPEPAPAAEVPATLPAPVPEGAAPAPPTQAGPGADVLQGFRPMRGQTRPGI